MRLIDADALIKVVERQLTGALTENERNRLLGKIPTIDAVSVVHGEWIDAGTGLIDWKCTACGFITEASAAPILYKYCPNCGADMRGVDNE